MAPITEEAVKALELMPVGLLESEIDSDKAPKLESIKYTTLTLRKLSYLGYYINGMGDLEEVVPHAIQLEAAINEWTNIGHVEKAMAFKKSLAGTALATANSALQSLRTRMENQDANRNDEPRATFHDFIVAYCQETGHTEDRHNQREGIRYMKKTNPEISVHQWWAVLARKNDLIPYLQGQGNTHDDNEMKWVFFKSMPESWKDAFNSDGNNDISASTIKSIKTFMKQQEAKSRAKMASNKARQTAEKKRDRSGDGD